MHKFVLVQNAAVFIGVYLLSGSNCPIVSLLMYYISLLQDSYMSMNILNDETN